MNAIDNIMALATAYADERVLAVRGRSTEEDVVAADQALRTAIEQALSARVPVPIKWELNGDKTCGYNNWLGTTPFGRILITWKSWKAGASPQVSHCQITCWTIFAKPSHESKTKF
jgi:hypothetical protein